MCRTAVDVTMTVTLTVMLTMRWALTLTKTEQWRLKKARSRIEPGRTYRRAAEGGGGDSDGDLGPDMEFVKKFTQARFFKTKFYPKVRKSQ